jgi:hypothetical protein
MHPCCAFTISEDPAKFVKKFKLTLYSSQKASFLLFLMISLTAVKM